MKTLILAGHPIDSGGSAPAEIVFIPEGSHKITPQSHPKGIMVKLTAERGAAVAAAFQQSLQRRLSENVKPWFDFEHSRKFPASGYPTSFRYEPGVGLMASVEWSGSGRTAIEGKDVRYFSPEFYVDDEGTPAGIPNRGPLGGLVTEPAFRGIPTITASDSDADTDFEAEVERMVAAGQASNLQEAFDRVAASKPGLYQEYCSRFSGRPGTGDESSPERRENPLGELQSRANDLVLSNAAPDHASALLMAAESDSGLYEDYRESLADGRSQTSQQSTADGSSVDPVEEMERRANDLVSTGAASSFADGLLKAAEADPDLYSAYTQKLSG